MRNLFIAIVTVIILTCGDEIIKNEISVKKKK